MSKKRKINKRIDKALTELLRKQGFKVHDLKLGKYDPPDLSGFPIATPRSWSEHFPADERQKIDDYHWHEALDRAHIMVEQFDALLLTHPVLEQDVALRQLAQEIADRLAALYQTIGTRAPGPVEPTTEPETYTLTLTLNPEEKSRLLQSLYFHTNFLTSNTETMSDADKVWEAGQRALIAHILAK